MPDEQGTTARDILKSIVKLQDRLTDLEKASDVSKLEKRIEALETKVEEIEDEGGW